MTDLVTTGPEMMELRWGPGAPTDDGRTERAFRPATAHQADPGYLHPGVLAAAVLGAARTNEDVRPPIRSVSVAVDEPVPLGGELVAVTVDDGDGAVAFQLLGRDAPGTEDDPIDRLARGEVRTGTPEAPPNLGAWRSLADVPVPEPQPHELHAGCYVCGGENPQGLSLQPGWHAPDTVVNGFVANQRMAEGDALSLSMVAAVLSCPTLWACRDALDASNGDGAVLTDYEVTFLGDATVTRALRTAAMAGASERDVLRGSSALLDEDGQVYAVAQASWRIVDEAPAREPGRPAPVSEQQPLRGGRAERSPDASGQPLPGRREAPGPRSERAGDHDGRDSMGIDHDRDGGSHG